MKKLIKLSTNINLELFYNTLSDEVKIDFIELYETVLLNSLKDLPNEKIKAYEDKGLKHSYYFELEDIFTVCYVNEICRILNTSMINDLEFSIEVFNNDRLLINNLDDLDLLQRKLCVDYIKSRKINFVLDDLYKNFAEVSLGETNTKFSKELISKLKIFGGIDFVFNDMDYHIINYVSSTESILIQSEDKENSFNLLISSDDLPTDYLIEIAHLLFIFKKED